MKVRTIDLFKNTTWNIRASSKCCKRWTETNWVFTEGHKNITPNKSHLLPAFPLTLRIQGWSSTLNSRVMMPYFFLRASSLCFFPNSLPAAPSWVSSSAYIRLLLMSRSMRAWTGGKKHQKESSKEGSDDLQELLGIIAVNTLCWLKTAHFNNS